MARITATTAERTTAVCAGIPAALLLGYSISIAAVALTQGIEGPQEVSSPTGVAVEVVTFALLGVGVAVVAIGRWSGRSWSSVPFVVIQLLALTVGVPMMTGAGAGVPVGAVVSATALAGLAALAVATAKRSGRTEAGAHREQTAQN